MQQVNLKRLSIDELNALAGSIIDELSTRSDDEPAEGKDVITRFIDSLDKEDALMDEMDKLENDKEFIEDEIERVSEEIEKIEYEQDELIYELNVS